MTRAARAARALVVVVVVVAGVLCSASAARAQVAVAVTYDAGDAAQRDAAAAVVDAVSKKWSSVVLPRTIVDACNADRACLVREARAHTPAVDWLLMVAVAPVTARDNLVAVEMYTIDAAGATQMVKVDDLAPARVPALASSRDLDSLVFALLKVDGPPPATPPVILAPSAERTPLLAYVGAGLVAGGGVVGGATLGAFGLLHAGGNDPQLEVTAAIAGSALAAALVVGGVACLSVD